MKTITTKRIRRIAAAAAISIGIGGLIGGNVSADAPIEFSDSVTFSDINPCTIEPMEVTVNVDVSVHTGHKNNVVLHVSRTGTTSDGYVMAHGVETIQENKNVLRAVFNDIWRNDDGSSFQVRGVFVAKQSGIVVDRFRLRCFQP